MSQCVLFLRILLTLNCVEFAVLVYYYFGIVLIFTVERFLHFQT